MYGKPPKWKSSDKVGSFAKLAEAFNEKARYDFLNSGNHPEIIYLVCNNGRMGVFPVSDGPQRDKILTTVVEIVRQDRPYGMIHIIRAWTDFSRSEKGRVSMRITRIGKDAEMISSEEVAKLKKANQTEALVVEMESIERASKIWLNPIIRGGGSVKLALADAIIVDEQVGGRFRTFFGS